MHIVSLKLFQSCILGTDFTCPCVRMGIGYIKKRKGLQQSKSQKYIFNYFNFPRNRILVFKLILFEFHAIILQNLKMSVINVSLCHSEGYIKIGVVTKSSSPTHNQQKPSISQSLRLSVLFSGLHYNGINTWYLVANIRVCEKFSMHMVSLKIF